MHIFHELGGIGLVIIDIGFEQSGGNHDVVGLLPARICHDADTLCGRIATGNDFQLFQLIDRVGQLVDSHFLVVLTDQCIPWCRVIQITLPAFCRGFDKTPDQIRLAGNGFLQRDDGGAIGRITLLGKQENSACCLPSLPDTARKRDTLAAQYEDRKRTVAD